MHQNSCSSCKYSNVHDLLVILLLQFISHPVCILWFTVTYVQQVLDKVKELQYGSLALVVGRYYAMDRDKRFERNKIAFEGMVQGIGEVATPDTVIEVRLPHTPCTPL